MKKNDKTRKQLLIELEKSNAIIVELEKSEAKYKQAEEKLRSAEENLINTFNISPGLICVADANTRYFTECNLAVTRILGISVEEFTSKPFMEFIHPDDRQGTVNEITMQLKGSPVANFENRYRCNDGSYKWLSWQATAADKNGKVYAVATDITERKLAEEALRESEKQLQTLIDAMPDFVCFKDGDRRWLKANNACIRIFQLEGIDYRGKKDSQLAELNSNLRGTFLTCEETDARALKEERLFHGEETILDPDGSVRVYDVTKVAVFHPSGEPKGLVVMGHDITERKQTEEEIGKLSTAVKQSPSVIAITDLKGNLEYVNPKFTGLTGYSSEEVIGQNPRILKSGELPDKIYKELWDTITSGKVWHGEFHNTKKNGEYFWEAVSISPIFDKQGKITNYIKIAEDITSRKKAEEELRESEQRFRSYFEMSLVGMAITSVEKGWIDANNKICEILGYSLDELKQKTWVELTYTDDLDADLEKFNQVLENKIDSYSMEKRFIRKNGALVFTKISVGCVRNSDGSVNYIVLLMEDITDRKIDEIVIRKSEERWQFALEGSGDGVWDWSIQLNEVFFSKQWKAMLGFKEDEISENMEEWDKRIHPDDIEKVHEDIQKHFNGKTPVYENEHRIRCKDGSYKWIYSRGKVISRTDDEKPLRMIGTHSDITGRKRAKLELVKHRDKLEDLIKERTDEVERSQKSLVLLMEDVNEVNQELKSVNTILDATNTELEAFSYSVSHDLRAPLTRMDGFSKALIDSYSSNLDDKGVHFLNRIRASSQHMAKLIDDLLSLSRITREKVTRQKVDLSQTAGKIANELKASEPVRKVEFEIAKGLSANADRKFVEIILENLLGNSFKFTGKKENAVIEFGEKIIDKDEVFFIKDNGTGFNMKYYNKIFTAFQRLHSEKEYKGTGIGLAIVQRIINKHGGKIWAESEEGKGATFYFRFE